MSVKTDSRVLAEEGVVNQEGVVDEVPPPLIVEGEIDTNKTEEANEEGVESNREGEESNREGEESNREGEESNREGVESNREGVEPNEKGEESNREGVEPEKNEQNRNEGVAVDQDGGDGKVADQSDVSKEEEEEVEFSLPKLKQLDEQLGRPKWVVPVRARDELEMLIRGAITLTRQGKDNELDECQRFYKEGLTTSFVRILTDDAVNTWKQDIQMDIFNNSLLLVELCCLKIRDDNIFLLDILSVVLNPSCKWHIYNSQEPPRTCTSSENANEGAESDMTTAMYARPRDSGKHNVKGRLIDLLNLFGRNGGFQSLYDRVCGEGQELNVQILAYLLRPIGYCCEFLSDWVYDKYIIPVVDRSIAFLNELSDDLLKKEAASDTRSETFSSIMKSLRHLCHRIPGREDIETFRLKMILRLLQISSFSGKMNALNEINKIIPTSVSYHPHFRTSSDDDQLSVERIGEWIKGNNVLSIVFRDNLHQPQYVEKLDRLVRFCIKEKVLTVEDLDMIWACQDGKHEAIVKNIHDLLVKLAWDFSPDQLDHLFGCFQRSWVESSKKQRNELLDFIRHLAEDDKDGIMASKVLELLWNLARREDCPAHTMEHALNAHIKILDYSCSQERESQKLHWLQKCVEEVTHGRWVIPTLKQMKEICLLYVECPVNYSSNRHSSSKFFYRNEIIHHLDDNHQLLSHICTSVDHYMEQVRALVRDNKDINPETFCIDGKFNHYQQLQIRLDFVRFALKDGQLWLGLNHALTVWHSLAQNPVFLTDRDICFKWFAKLASWDEPDLDSDSAQSLFTDKILALDPSSLTDNGLRCFDRFFRMVNLSQHSLSKWNRSSFITESVETLIGRDYLWECILQSSDDIVHKPIELMKDIFTNLSTKLPQDQIHQGFIDECIQRMELIFNGLKQYKPGEIAGETKEVQAGFNNEVTKLVRCLKLLIEYAVECDEEHMEERGIPPHGKAYWGKPLMFTIRYFSGHAHQPEDYEVFTHSNETIAALRRHIVRKLSLSGSSKLELSVGNDVIRKTETHRYVMTASVPLRDKMMIQARLQQFNSVGETSIQSSDNSTDSSEGSGHYDGPSIEAERGLPSVLMASHSPYVDLFLEVCDYAVRRGLVALRDAVRGLLKLLPTSLQLLTQTLDYCQTLVSEGKSLEEGHARLRSYVLSPSPSRTVYLLELIHSMLMPSVETREAESNNFQLNFIKCGGTRLVFQVLTDPTFLLECDNNMKRSAYTSCLKILKLLLLSQAYTFILSVSQQIGVNADIYNSEQHLAACKIQETMKVLINNNDQRLKHTATMIAKNLPDKVSSPQPDLQLIQSLQCISWSSAVGDLALLLDPAAISEKLSRPYTVESDDTHLARDSLEAMTFAMAVSPKVLDQLYLSKQWRPYLIDIVLRVRNRLVRVSAQDQLFNCITRCCTTTTEVLLDTVGFLFEALENVVSEYPSTSNEFFRLLARLINHSVIHNLQLKGVKELLHTELKWLEEIRTSCLSSQSVCIESQLLEGHLTLIVELIACCSIEERYSLGSKPDGMNLIPKLLNDFLFPASRVVKQLKKNADTNYSDQLTTGICSSTDSIMAAYKLINALSVGCIQNIETVSTVILGLFYSEDDPPLMEWEFFPHVGPRPSRGFVGLKNAGATCYMNAVLQQLYLISPVCNGVLQITKAAQDLIKQEETEAAKKALTTTKEKKSPQIIEADPPPPPSPSDERKETNCQVMRQLQCIFGHLLEGRVQFYIPRGFWRDFRLEGQKVNVREQHDAFEFFNTVVDSVDEGLKVYGAPPTLSRTLGGSFADQKICKGCPHRYSREEPFTAINVDIRLHHNLFESLDSYVKGDLLEGANAYHCEKCSKKVDTVKRMCIKKLPKVLVIQLKRFDYDWEREMAVKFNDYFEFPREFDVSPYTASGLAEKEGEEIPDTDEKKGEEEELEREQLEREKGFTTKYRLRGVVVHSGQASGGHYYSFAHISPSSTEEKKWYKFDDGDVSEAKMEEDEELKSQCFGGEYTGEVYDHVLKKTHQRRQKRWWSAYLLFYDRLATDGSVQQSTCSTGPDSIVPQPILKQVHRQNLEYLHTRAHFNYAYFQFMKQILILNFNFAKQQVDSGSAQDPMESFERVGMQCIQLVSKFLFHTGFHTKKTLRGSANEWFDALNPYLHYSASIRRWFCQEVFLCHTNRLCEFVLESPSAELRNMFAKLIPFLCHATNKDEHFEVQTQTNAGIAVSQHSFSEIIFSNLLLLLKKEVSDHSRHIQQYFQVFLAYCHKGPAERQQLLRLGVPAQFIAVALDEGPGPALRSPYADLTKLYSVVGQLVRCCDVTRLQRSYKEGEAPLPNPYADDLSVKLPNDLHHWLFERASSQHGMTYIKKIIEDNTPIDELVRFLGFCSWENWEFSAIVVADILVEIATVQPFDMRPYLDLLLHLLMMTDSWQMQRIRAMFLGIQDRAEGMILLIQHGQSHVVHQKRGYLCIKFIVNLCNRCPMAQMILDSDTHLKNSWHYSLQWLQNELDRRQYSTSSYPYSGWSPPSQSNEVSNSYFLERSNSAKMTLSRARELFPMEEPEVATDRYQGRQQSEEDSSTTGERLLDKEEEFNDLDQLDPPPPSTEVNEMALNNADLD